MGRNLIETVMGGVVLLIAALFLFFAYTRANVSPVKGYQVTAKFNKIDGLDPGGDVRIRGVKVGSVMTGHLDPKEYRAVITMSIAAEVRLPVDSTATITSDGLLGGKYVKLEPGKADVLIEPGGEIANTEDGVALEELIGRMIFLATES